MMKTCNIQTCKSVNQTKCAVFSTAICATLDVAIFVAEGNDWLTYR